MTMRRAWQMLELAKRFDSKSSGHSMLQHFLEEKVVGIQSVLRTPTIKLDSVRYMINFDMVGRLRGDDGCCIRHRNVTGLDGTSGVLQ